MRESIVRLENVSFQYYGNDRVTLSNVSFEIRQGEWIAIIGPNGSGKSTLAKVMNGLLVADGNVYIHGKLLSDETVWSVRRSVGMVFQNPDNQFVGSTVEDDVAFGLENNGIKREEMLERIDDALKQVRMLSFKTKEPSRLSGGQKQRVALASILALRPQVIILDEATSMLDPKGRIEVIEAIRSIKERFDLTVISITHDIDEASLADRILVMNNGELINQGTPKEIFSTGESLMDIGLDVPFSYKVQLELAKLGVSVPNRYLDEEELMQWILTSYLKT